MHTTRKCPLCGSNQATLFKTMEYAHEESFVLPTTLRISSCNNCGLVFDDLDASQDVFECYYHEASKYAMTGIAGSGDLSPTDRIRYEAIFQRIQPLLKDKSVRIVDIGCGKGGLLRIFKEHGYENLCGIDASEVCTQVVAHSGIPSICKNINRISEIKQKFDIVIFSHIFEHLFDLRQVMLDLKNLLDYEGITYIEVPDAAHYVSHFSAPFYYFDQEHINHFTEQSLSCLANFYSFQILESKIGDCYVTEKNANPICYVMLKNTQNNHSENLVIHQEQEILNYISFSQVKEDKLVLPCPNTVDKIFFWGMGSWIKHLFTTELFSAIVSNHKNRVFLIDKDSKKSGRHIQCGCENLEIFSPEILNQYNSHENIVFVSSVLYHEKILFELEEMGWKGMKKDIALF